MGNLTSSLKISLIDDVSKPAKTVAAALKQAETNAKSIAQAMSKAGATDRFAANLSKLKLSAKDIEQVSKAWRDYSKSAGLAAKASDWTKNQAAGVKAWESRTIASLRSVKREQMAFNRSMSAAGGIHPMTAAMSANALANARLKAGMHGPMAAGAIAAAAGAGRGIGRGGRIAATAGDIGSSALMGAGLGGGAVMAAGVAGGAAFGVGSLAAKSVQEAVGQDEYMADVRKKITLAQGDTYESLQRRIAKIGRETGLGFEGAASIYAQGGQAGIPGADLENFSRLAAKTAAAWDIPAKQAAQSLSEIRAQTGWTIEQLGTYASRVNHLGDVSAAAEKDISEMFARSAAGAKASGLSYADSMVALTALKSVGMETEVGARFLGQFSGKLRTATGLGKGAAQAFKELGLSAAEVESGMKADGFGTIAKVLQALEKSPDAAKHAQKLFGKEWWDEALRAKDALPEMIRLRKEMASGAGADSLDKAVETDMATTAAKAKRAWDGFWQVGAEQFKFVTGPMNSALDGIIARHEKIARDYADAELDRKIAMGAPLSPDERQRLLSDPARMERARRSAEARKPQGRSSDEYARQLKIGDPTKATAEQINAALPFARHNLDRFDPNKIWAKPEPKAKRRKGPPPVPVFGGGAQRPDSSLLEPTPRPLPKNAPLPPRRPQMEPQTAHAPEIGGSVPAFASGSGVTPKVDASQVEHLES
ncbi:MAG: phage tail tape measure protein, partial [Steroidobacteraceae bacterium]